MRTAIVAGATGLIGKQLMYKLLESSDYSRVYALVRKKFEIKHPKLVQLDANYAALSSLPIDGIVSDVFCCLGTTMAKAGSKEAFFQVDYTFVLNLAKHFLAEKSSQFLLVSANGADANSSIYYSKVKGQIEQEIAKLGYKSIHIFRPSILMGAREEFRLGERIGIAVALLLRPLMIGGLQKYRPIYGAEVAKGMLSKALEAREGVFFYESNEISN